MGFWSCGISAAGRTSIHGGKGLEKTLKGCELLACGGLSECVWECCCDGALNVLGGGGGGGLRRGPAFAARIVSATRCNCWRRMLAGCNLILGVGDGLVRGEGLLVGLGVLRREPRLLLGLGMLGRESSLRLV